MDQPAALWQALPNNRLVGCPLSPFQTAPQESLTLSEDIYLLRVRKQVLLAGAASPSSYVVEIELEFRSLNPGAFFFSPITSS